MTRINVVPPGELENMHLLAEYRELPRIFALAKAFHLSGKKEDFPDVYTLGKGHVKFFYNKLLWLANRQKALVDELLLRGYNPNFDTPDKLLDGCPQAYLNDYQVTSDALTLNRQRIALRLYEYEQKMKAKADKK